MHPTDAEIVAAVAGEQAWIEGVLERLVAAPTLLGAEDEGQQVMRDAIRELGLEPIDVPLDPDRLRAHPGHSPFSWEVRGKRNVIARWGPWSPEGEGARSLILNGHIDVVSPVPEHLWTSPPFEPTRDGDWLVGRGAGDMKCGLAAMLGAVRGLRRLGLRPQAQVELQSVVEEEITGSGALQCVLDGSPADGAVVVEPTHGEIWNAQVGVLWFHVHVHGRPAHAGEASHGHSAIDAAQIVIGGLRRLEVELNVDPPPPFDVYEHPIFLNVGVIRGGDWPSMVAGECDLGCRIALFPGDSVDELKARVEDAVAQSVAHLPGLQADVTYDGFACDGYAVPADIPIAQAMAGAAERLTGRQPGLHASTATTDARILGLYGGTPTICYGPRAENTHAPDERVLVPSVVETAQALALLIADWCGLVPDEHAHR